MSSQLTRLARDVMGSLPLPLAEWFLRKAAMAPPRIKTAGFERLCSALFGNALGRNQLVRTNLGISSSLACDVPRAKLSYVFGRPENYLSERATLALASAICTDCSDFLDVGANEGIFIFTISNKAEEHLRLHCFEPDNAVGDRLERNLRLNRINSYYNRLAVSDRSGSGIFLRNLTDDASGSLVANPASHHEMVKQKVDTISLADYFESRDIRDALVKIDVEGGGSLAWIGARQIALRIRYLIMEMLAPEIIEGLPARIIKEGNFHAYYIHDFSLEPFSGANYRYTPPFWNWLFCRLDETALAERLASTPFRIVPQC